MAGSKASSRLFQTCALLLAAGLPAARAGEEPAECPAGTHRVSTDNPYQPFRCADEVKDEGFGVATGPRGFKFRPKCPNGTHAVAAQGLQPYRCAEDAPAGPAAEDPLTRGCPRGSRKTRTSDLLRPFQCVKQAPAAPRANAYRRYAIPAEMSFDYPSLFQPRDGWREDVPTISFTFDDGSPGKPVMITITKVEQAQPTFIDLDSALAKDEEWRGAADGGSATVAGLKARVTFVAGDSKTAYVPLSKASYYTIVYSAPEEAYQTHLGAFEHLLKTLRLTRRGR